MEIAKVNPAEISAKFKLEVARLNLQRLIDETQEIVWSEENVTTDMLLPARTALEELKRVKDEGKRPHLDACQAYDKAYKDASEMLINVATLKNQEKQRLIERIEAERQKQEAERRRIEGITTSIKDFIVNMTRQALSASSHTDIVQIEMRIGSELSRKSFYQEFHGDLAEKISEIRPILAKQKALIKEKEDLERQRQEFEAEKDERLAEILEQKEDIGIELLQNRQELHHTAANIMSFEIPTQVGETVMPTIAPKRRQWTYEISDLSALAAKMPNLVKIQPDTAAINEYIRRLKTEGKLKDGQSVEIPGMKIYQKKTY